mmetsp:Transcript_16922/g.33908  ORF Transcript_16922/g.33908 Transcript_16922/m.33908 type:complete len:98 (+) Transcript_16922:1189-1482(+)
MREGRFILTFGGREGTRGLQQGRRSRSREQEGGRSGGGHVPGEIVVGRRSQRGAGGYLGDGAMGVWANRSLSKWGFTVLAKRTGSVAERREAEAEAE